MDDDALYSQTLDKIVRKLKGKYGFKRFLRDGYRTTNEDKNRRHYKPAEMKVSVVSISVYEGKEMENEKSLFPHIWELWLASGLALLFEKQRFCYKG